MARCAAALVALGQIAVASAQAAAAAAANDTPQTIVVTGRSANLVGVSDSATEGAITAAQLANRPLLRPGELLESVPGMIVTQHPGDGKGEPVFPARIQSGPRYPSPVQSQGGHRVRAVLRYRVLRQLGLGVPQHRRAGSISTVNPSNGSATEPVSLISRAMNAEIGLRTSPLAGWNMGPSLTIRLASELVIVGDDGVTEPKGGSRRIGVEWWNDATINRWINIDADVVVSFARFEQVFNGRRYVPNSIPLLASLGITADAKGRWLAGVRLRYFGA
jgi:hypothetical protein